MAKTVKVRIVVSDEDFRTVFRKYDGLSVDLTKDNIKVSNAGTMKSEALILVYRAKGIKPLEKLTRLLAAAITVISPPEKKPYVINVKNR